MLLTTPRHDLSPYRGAPPAVAALKLAETVAVRCDAPLKAAGGTERQYS